MLAFCKCLSYNISCVEGNAKKHKKCAFSSVGRAVDS